MTVKALTLIAVLGLLLALFTYMYRGMQFIMKQQKDRTYKPRPVKSGLELFAFLVIYTSCSYLATYGKNDLELMIVLTLITFILSFFLFNKVLVEKIGKYSIPLATIIMFVFYCGISFSGL